MKQKRYQRKGALKHWNPLCEPLTQTLCFLPPRTEMRRNLNEARRLREIDRRIPNLAGTMMTGSARKTALPSSPPTQVRTFDRKIVLTAGLC
jgi:hypothetical protein